MYLAFRSLLNVPTSDPLSHNLFLLRCSPCFTWRVVHINKREKSQKEGVLLLLSVNHVLRILYNNQGVLISRPDRSVWNPLSVRNSRHIPASPVSCGRSFFGVQYFLKTRVFHFIFTTTSNQLLLFPSLYRVSSRSSVSGVIVGGDGCLL